MQYVGRAPSPPLERFVERIWYCSDTPTHERERVIPGGGTMDLVANLAEDESRIYDLATGALQRTRSGTIVAGPRTRSIWADPRQRASVVGVHFRPGGAFPFIGISPAKLVDQHVPLAELWGSDGRRLRKRLLAAKSPEERFDILEAALEQRLQRAPVQHPAVRTAVEALREPGCDGRVGEVAALVGLSRRRFIEVFEREVGITPKLYSRLQRFHRVKQHIAALGAPPASWAAFAIDCGYCDQSHMIRDFVEFSGMSPESYLRCGDGETRFDQLIHAYPGPASA